MENDNHDKHKTSRLNYDVRSNLDPNLIESFKSNFTSLNSKKRKELEASLGWLFLTDNIKKRTREKIQNHMRKNDGLALIFATIGVITNIIASTMYIAFEQLNGKFKLNLMYIFNHEYYKTF